MAGDVAVGQLRLPLEPQNPAGFFAKILGTETRCSDDADNRNSLRRSKKQQTNTPIFGRSLSSSHQHYGVQTTGLCQFEQASVVKLCRNLLEHELWDSFGSITDRKFKSSGVESGPLQEKALFQQLGIVLNFPESPDHVNFCLTRLPLQQTFFQPCRTLRQTKSNGSILSNDLPPSWLLASSFASSERRQPLHASVGLRLQWHGPCPCGLWQLWLLAPASSVLSPPQRAPSSPSPPLQPLRALSASSVPAPLQRAPSAPPSQHLPWTTSALNCRISFSVIATCPEAAQ